METHDRLGTTFDAFWYIQCKFLTYIYTYSGNIFFIVTILLENLIIIIYNYLLLFIIFMKKW